MMERTVLLARLDTATTRAAKFAIEHSMPIPGNKDILWVGKTSIQKNKNGFFDILTLTNDLLYSDIFGSDIATIISQRYTSGEFSVIRKVLALEGAYSKHHTDMMHYLHCMKAAKIRKDYDTLSILEDKFQISEIRAKNVKASLSVFKKQGDLKK